ncbi:MAG: GNAT family N-acetyltransferase [Clostridia bacterium]|nr:GNAT family N-acetyltransferase [Clostridia bacterium]
MTEYSLISVREHPEMADDFIAFFQRHWASEDSMRVYEDCIRSCLHAGSPLPQWYALVSGGRIIAGAGLITNDFISRMDLWPWLAALYVEEDFRGHALGAVLLRHARRHAAQLGFETLYLCTDHVGYYEKYGFAFIGEGHHPWGESSRIYCAPTLG